MEKATLEPIDITRGNDYNIVLAFLESTDPDEYVNLSDFTDIKADFREGKAESSPLVFSKSLGSGITVSGTGNKTLTIALLSANTELFDQGKYYFDIAFYIGSVLSTWVEGTIIVDSNTTAI